MINKVSIHNCDFFVRSACWENGEADIKSHSLVRDYLESLSGKDARKLYLTLEKDHASDSYFNMCVNLLEMLYTVETQICYEYGLERRTNKNRITVFVGAINYAD